MRKTSMGGAPPGVSMVVRGGNEAGNIAPLIPEIAARLDKGVSFEIIYVNDGSSDRTQSELTLLMASRPWLRQIKHHSSCGQSDAVHTRVRHARAPGIGTLHAQVQNEPAFLPALL